MMAGPFAEAASERADLAMGVLTEMAEAHPSEPHWYLEGLGTHPDWQRSGFASEVLAPVLGLCSDRDGLPAYLEFRGKQRSVLPSAWIRGHRHEATFKQSFTRMWLMWREFRPVRAAPRQPMTKGVSDIGRFSP